MCAPCKIILDNVTAAVGVGRSIHTAVNESIASVIGDLPPDVQNKLSALDAGYVRARLDQDKRYFDDLVAILSKFAEVEF